MVHDGVCSATALRLESVFRIEEDGDGALIDQLHGHHGLKNSGGDGNAQIAERLAELVIERFCKLWRRRSNEAGPPLAARVAVQRELRDGQRTAFEVEQDRKSTRLNSSHSQISY